MIVDVHRAASVTAIRRSILHSHSIRIIGIMTTVVLVSVVGIRIRMVAWSSGNRNGDRHWLRNTCMLYSMLMAVCRRED